MKSSILHPLLGSDKSNPLIEILIDPATPEELLVHFATRHLETVTANSFEEKLLIARLYNADFSRKRLQEVFGFDRKTMQSWGDALKSGKGARIQKIFFGQGPEPKIKPVHENFIRKKYHEFFPEHGCHTNAKIREELKDTFDLDVCYETIRPILVEEKEKMAESILAEAREKEEELRWPVVKYSDESADADRISSLFNPIVNSHSTVRERSGKSENIQYAKKLEYPLVEYTAEFESADRVPPRSNQAVNSQSIHNSTHRENPEKRENTCENGASLSRESSKKSNYSPSPGQVGLPDFPTVKKIIEQPFFCHHAGLVLCRLSIDKVSKNLRRGRDIVRQWISMILCGCKNIENGQKLDYGALEFLIGKQLWSSFRQRKKLRGVATEESVLGLLRENMVFLLADGLDTFLYDPHGVGYTGMLKTLLGWLGGAHKVGKAYYQDFIHTVDGAPVFLDIDDNYYDMRDRFIINVVKFRKILSGDRDRLLTFVVDRAIYDVEYMKTLREKHHIFIITWEKNYQKGQWREISREQIRTFYIIRQKNKAEDSITYEVQYVRRRWDKEPSFSQFIILLKKPHSAPIELSVLCTDETRPDLDALKPILRRWLQEIDFIFLIKLGINEITSYKFFSYQEIADGLRDRNFENRERKKLCAERLKLQKKLGMELVKLENFLDEKESFANSSKARLNELNSEIAMLEKRNTSADKLQKSKKERNKLKQKIRRFPKKEERFLNKNTDNCKRLREKIKEIEAAINLEPRELSRLQSMLEGEYRKLNFMPKAYLDCAKIFARNIIYEILKQFRPLYNNFRNDIVILRELIEAPGYIEETNTTITVYLYPPRRYPESVRAVIIRFLLKISYEINSTYKLDKTIVLDIYSAKK